MQLLPVRPMPWALAACVVVTTSVSQGREPMTVETFARAESDLYFATFVTGGSFGEFAHARASTPINSQDVIRMNRDTLYILGRGES